MDIIVEGKAALREEIGDAVAAFLKRGGKVDRQPILVRGADAGLYADFARAIQMSAEAAKAAKRGRGPRAQEDGYVNIRQMAGMTGLSDTTLRHMAQRGDLPPACKIGHKRTQWWKIERVQPIIDKIKARKGG